MSKPKQFAVSNEYYCIKSYPISTVYEIFLNDIGEACDFNELISVLYNAGENDIIKVYINSNGGDLMTGMQILNAMEMSNASIMTILDGQASSMGGIILLAGSI